MTSEFTIAIHAMVYLSFRKATVSSDLLAENVCTNPARIRKVMGRLKKAGMVATKEGLDGGYHMEKPAASLTLKDVGEALEVDFVSASWKSGDHNRPCLISSGMGGVMDGIYEELNELCKSRLKDITIEDIGKQIFVDNKKK